MGFFSKLWKGVKNVFGGIMKIFSPILKPLAKILNSSWGKILMLAVSVFTFGAALLAGAGAFSGALAGGQGFLAAFVEGGKAFMGSLLGKGAEEGAAAGAEGIAEGAAAAAEGGVLSAVDPMALNQAAGAGAEVANIGGGALSSGASTQMAKSAGQAGAGAGAGVAGAGGMGGMPNLPVPAGATAAQQAAGVGTVATTGATTGAITAGSKTGGNWLTKAASKAWDFVQTDAGQNLIGAGLKGYAAGELQKSQERHESRYDRMWQDPNQTQPIRDLSANFDPNVPDRWNRDPQTLAQQRQSEYTSSVPFRRAPVGG